LTVKKVTQTEVALPEAFPKDVPLYPKATITAASTEGRMTLSLKTSDSSQKAEAFYKENLVKNGWSQPTTITVPMGNALRSTKDNRAVSVLCSGGGGYTMISISVTDKK
jgi:hypothetical protein